MMALAQLFLDGIRVSGVSRFLLMLPLCLAIALVYKATRLENLRQLPLAAGVLWITIVVVMYLVGIALWGMYTLLA